MSPFIVGITGGSASGKTSFLKALLGSFDAKHICLLSQDNYYKNIEFQPRDEKGVHNFDTPDSILIDEYATDLKSLRNGNSITRLEYIFNRTDIQPRLLVYTPAPIVVVEGIFVFYFSELKSLIDLKVFIDAKEHVKLKRRILRDRDERGSDLNDVLYRFENHVVPAYERYIEPFKNESDLIIPNNSGFNKALEVLIAFLKTKI